MAVYLPPSLSAAQRITIYDDKDEQLNGGGLLDVRTEIVSKVWREVAEGGMRCRPPFHGPRSRLFSVAAP